MHDELLIVLADGSTPNIQRMVIILILVKVENRLLHWFHRNSCIHWFHWFHQFSSKSTSDFSFSLMTTALLPAALLRAQRTVLYMCANRQELYEDVFWLQVHWCGHNVRDYHIRSILLSLRER